MPILQSGGVPYIVFSHFENTGLVRHGFSTRLGGVSEGGFARMNLGAARGDDPERVAENFRRMAVVLGVRRDSMVFSRQVHGDTLRAVREVSPCEAGTDGLLTDQTGLTLVTFYADCVPLFLLDPVRRAAALSHAGWRGTAADIGAKTVARMAEVFGSRPADILAGIGPSIGPCCFEVGEDVAEAFRHDPACVHPKGNGKYQADLWRRNRQGLLSAGLLNENIETAGLCTMCRADLFYSHRRSGPDRGSMAAFMALRGPGDEVRDR